MLSGERKMQKNWFIQLSSGFIVIASLIFGLLYSETQTLPTKLPEERAKNIAFFCKEIKFREQCYSQQLGLLTAETDIALAKKVLKNLQDLDSTATGCHLIAHTIAIEQTKKDPEKWLELLKEQDYHICTGGFLHGVLEAHSRYDPNFNLTADKFFEICSQVKDRGTGELSCNHNLGHILLSEQDGSIQKSVLICSRITEYIPKYECLSGVFMENLTRLNLLSHGIAERIPWDVEHTKGIEKLCQEYKIGLAAMACWKEISYMFITINSAEPAGVFESCKKAPTKAMQDQCYIYGAGNMVVFSTFDESRLNSVCNVYDQDNSLYKTCMYQIIGSQMASSDKLAERIIDLCSKSEDFQKECFDYFFRTLGRNTITEERVSEICSKVPGIYGSECVIKDKKI